MVFGIQINLRQKWNSSFTIDNLFKLQILIMQIGGHWPINYERILPTNYSYLSKYINICVMIFVTCLSWHISVLYFIKFWIQTHTDDEVSVVDISDSLMSVILHLYGGFGSIYLQLYHKKCKQLIENINEKFRKRSAKGRVLD